MMVAPPPDASERSRLNQHGPGWETWGLLALLLCQIGIFKLEWELAHQAPQFINGLFTVPFFAGVFLLPLRQLAVLGGSSALLLAITTELGHDFALPQAKVRLPFQLLVLLICLWGCRQRQQLQRSNALLETIFTNSPVSKALCERSSGRIVMANQAMSQMLGIPQTQLVGQRWNNFACPDTIVRPQAVQVLHTARGPRHAEVIISLIKETSSNEAFEIIQALDCEQRINDQRCLEQRTSELQQALQVSLRSSVLVHDVRQPLALLLLQIQRLTSLPPADHDQLQELLSGLQMSGERINAAVNGIEALLCSANRREPESIELIDLVHTAIGRLQEQLRRQCVQLSCQQMATELVIAGDRRQLQIAIDNLVRNALEAVLANATGPRQIQVNLQRRPSHAVLCVHDNGPGLSTRDLSQLELNSRKANGLGLGLYIVRLVANHHQGTLSAGQSPCLGGAELRLSLALAPEGSPAEDNDSAPPDAPVRHR